MLPMRPPRSSSGDPARTLALLWRHALPEQAPVRGPRQGLTVDGVVEAAVDLADREGMESVTMRRVAAALGVAPMTLYTYVPGRDELVDLMLDEVYWRMRRPAVEAGDWRQRVRGLVEANRSLHEEHPWAAVVDTTRPALGPGAIAKYDRELAAFDGHGLDEVTMDAALAWTLAFVRDWAHTRLAAARIQNETALTDQQWWASAGPLLNQVLDPTEFPLATRVGTVAGQTHGAAWEPGHAFEFGLARVLDGLAGLFDHRDG
jgi:AcrR family transcriptional regulator